jgi:Pretoxin HINT domain
VTLVIRDATTGATQTIVSNRLHPFFVSNVSATVHLVANCPTLRGTLDTGRFVEAQHLDVGAWLVTETGLEAEVVAKTIARAPLTAYNLTVADFETYFVSGADNDNAPAVWVHNCSAQRLAHIFGQSKHMMDDLVASFGGNQVTAFRAIETAANQALAAGRLAVGPNGVMPAAGSILNVNGMMVQLSGGRVYNGTVAISSASRVVRLP